MRGTFGFGALCCLLATGPALFAADAQPPPSVAHPFAQPATSPQVPVAGDQGNSHAFPPTPQFSHELSPEFSSAPSAQRHRGSCWQRLRGWLTYRSQPAPRECKCHRCCPDYTPPLYSYFALRYPNAGHGHDPSPFLAPTPHMTGDHNP